MAADPRSKTRAGVAGAALLLLVGSGAPGAALAQGAALSAAAATSVAEATVPDTLVVPIQAVVVTATRTPKPVFVTPAPVNLIGRPQIRVTQPNTVTDLFREVPGLDVAGVGVQQPRPVIRGQRGQRILLMQDGLRLNNSRRQQDFGEIPGMVDVEAVERVEVVRGPSSVLYGTDAIGGVVNIITRTPVEDGIHGSAGYRFGSASSLHRGSANVLGRFGGLDVQFNTAFREAGAYDAPAGSFGAITLDSAATVFGTGVQDRSVAGRVGYRFDDRHGVFARIDHYRATDAGFGFVDPGAYDRSQPRIDIRYPEQTFRKIAFGYTGVALRTPFLDRAEVVGYVQNNDRDVEFNLEQALGPPGASIRVRQDNFSDVRSLGGRVEAKKLVLPGLLLTYGVDGFRDRSQNSDSSVTRITGFGPVPMVTVDRRPQVPNATFSSAGAFLQGEIALGRASVVLGSRVQQVQAETAETEGISEVFQSRSNRTVVGSASAIYALTDDISVLGSVGRGFRSPNLIEWFYDGLSTDGRFYQRRNPELEPETSLNVDLGVRLRRSWLNAEGFVFRNRIQDGIRTVPTEERLNNRVVYRNVNIDELIFRGLEFNADVTLPHRFALLGGYARQEARDARDANIPVGDLYSSKVVGTVRWGGLADRLWAEYGVRHHGEQREADLVDNPIGDAIPAFTVHNLRGGVTVFRRGDHSQRLGITVGNLTNRLYTETGNASFFRPEPGRHLTLSWEASF